MSESCQYCHASLVAKYNDDGTLHYNVCEHCGIRTIEGKSYLFGDKVTIVSWANYDRDKQQ